MPQRTPCRHSRHVQLVQVLLHGRAIQAALAGAAARVVCLRSSLAGLAGLCGCLEEAGGAAGMMGRQVGKGGSARRQGKLGSERQQTLCRKR